jgi:hypothetical protein
VGQAKKRGDYETRKAQAIARREAEQAKFKEVIERVEKRIAASKKPYPEDMLPAGMLAALALQAGMKGKK